MTNTNKLPIGYFILAILCGGILLFTTSSGIGIQSDTFGYIGSAQIIRNQGFLVENTLAHYAPLQSVMITVLGVNIELVRIAHAVILSANMLALIYALNMLNIQHWLVTLASLVFILTPEIIYRHSMIMSEPLFILLIQLAIIALAKEKWGWAIFFTALAPMQRYAGVGLIASASLYILLHYGLIRAFVFGFFTTLPIGLWFMRNRALTGDVGREASFNIISWEQHLVPAINTLTFWFLPALLICLVIAIVNRKNLRALSIPRIVRLSIIFVFGYLAFLVFTITFLNYWRTLGGRYLSPILPPMWISIVWFVHVQKDQLPKLYRPILLGSLSILLAMYIFLGALTAVAFNRNGVGLVEWIFPEYYSVMSQIPEDTFIYTNHWALIQYLKTTDSNLEHFRQTELPETYTLSTQRPNPNYEQEEEIVLQEIESGEAVIIWFTYSPKNDDNMITFEELEELFASSQIEGMVLFGHESIVADIIPPT